MGEERQGGKNLETALKVLSHGFWIQSEDTKYGQDEC